MSSLKTLTFLSRIFGSRPRYSQAAGGNVSLKDNSHSLLIKASGIRLRDVTPRAGWVRLSTRDLPAQLTRAGRQTSPLLREKVYADALRACAGRARLSPSMETGFHTVLPQRVVVHVHSVAGILVGLLPLKQRRTLLKKALPKGTTVHFVSPALPGYHLTAALQKQVKSNTPNRVHAWFLRNHGMVWAAPKAGMLKEAARRFERVCGTYFQLETYTYPHSTVTPGEFCFCEWPSFTFNDQPLFPDFEIYLRGRNRKLLFWRTGLTSVRVEGRNSAEMRDRAEVLYAHLLVTTLATPGGFLKTLPKVQSQLLKALETEKRRMRQAA